MQRRFAKQRTRPGDDVGFGTALRPQRERTLLDGVGAVGDVAGVEQHLTLLDPIAFGADGEDAQRRRAEPAQNRNPLKKRDIVLDRHVGRDSRDQLVAARFGDQDGWRSGILLDLLP